MARVGVVLCALLSLHAAAGLGVGVEADLRAIDTAALRRSLDGPQPPCLFPPTRFEAALTAWQAYDWLVRQSRAPAETPFAEPLARVVPAVLRLVGRYPVELAALRHSSVEMQRGLFAAAARLGVEAVEYPLDPRLPSRPTQPAALSQSAGWGPLNTHDPAGALVAGKAYLYSTDAAPGPRPLARTGLQARTSSDLIHWQFAGWALPGIPPAAAARVPQATELWAPDLVQAPDGSWRLYYAVSEFGRRNSLIGVAAAPSPGGPWTDQGEVVSTLAGDQSSNVNAIDPSVCVTPDGRHELAYGSWFGGLYVLSLDPATGKPSAPGPGVRVALSPPTGLEAPCLVWQPRFQRYYLFASNGKLDSTYNVRVARADAPTGPFRDRAGRDWSTVAEAGTKILNSYAFDGDRGWVGPGHAQVLCDGEEWFLAHHARHPLCLHVRRLAWTDDGWPVVSPERFAGESEQPLPAGALAGEWERLVLEPGDSGVRRSARVTVGAEMRLHDGNRATVGGDEVVVWPAWDWERGRATLVCSGFDAAGAAVWGKRR